jgi:integrase
MIRRQRYRGALPEARTKVQAEQAETKIKTKVYERKYGKVTASIPFTEFVHGVYLPWSRANKRSSSDDEFHAKVFCHHFGNKSLSEIDHQMIEEFKIKRMQSITRYGRTRKPASVNRELAILSGIFRMAVDYDEIPQNPCRKVQLLPENNQRTRHLSFEEEHRLFAEMTGEREYLRTLVTVAIYAGPRRGELLKLRWANVDFDLNTIIFKETKTNKDRSVPMEPIVRAVLLELLERAGDAEYVFVNPDTGTRYTDVKKSFSAACRKAGITDFRFHDLRHTFGTRLADAGVDVVKIKELMGHASIVTTMRYIHATDRGKRGAITVLSEYRQRHQRTDCRKFVAKEKRQSLNPAASR